MFNIFAELDQDSTIIDSYQFIIEIPLVCSSTVIEIEPIPVIDLIINDPPTTYQIIAPDTLSQ